MYKFSNYVISGTEVYALPFQQAALAPERPARWAPWRLALADFAQLGTSHLQTLWLQRKVATG